MRDYAKLVKALRETDFDVNCEYCDRDPCVEDCYIVQAADAIDELLAKVPHWISVEERLPEHYKPVLVAYIGFNSNLLLSDMIAYRDGDGDWCWWDGEFPSGEICEVKVTYWMPLPEPPKGVE